jgi:transcriptional regulator with XRE-family HTH domain
MTEEQSYSIGPIMKAARKFKKLNQAEVAHAMGCSQSALSKMEHNLLVPSAPQWFLFSRFTAIPPENLESGIIDRQMPINATGGEQARGFKIPKPYRNHRCQKVRELYPFLRFLDKTSRQAEAKTFIESTGIEAEFFVDFDNLVNHTMITDLIAHLIRLEVSSLRDIQEIITLGQDHIYWDHFWDKWNKMSSPQEVLQDFATHQLFFQADFTVKVDADSDGITVIFRPGAHMKNLTKDIQEEVVRFIHLYRKCTLEAIVSTSLGQKIPFHHIVEDAQPLQLGGVYRAQFSRYDS